MFSFFLVASALAGKLQDDNGFRGSSFGPSTVLEESAPMGGCVRNPVEIVLWRCGTNLGGHEVIVNYFVEEGLFSTMLIQSYGFDTCHEIKDILTSAWGTVDPVPDKVYIELYKWFDGDIVAIWEFNDLSDKCLITITNRKVQQRIIYLKQERAKAAIGGL